MKLSTTIKLCTAKAALLAILALSLASCSSTKIVSSWKAPEDTLASARPMNKVMVAVLAQNETKRRVFEDYLVSLNTSLQPSYKYLPSFKMVQDEEKAKQVVEQAGFDGVVTMKLVKKDDKESYVPGNYNYYPGYAGYGYWGYHSMFWSGYYDPGYYVEEHIYYIETNVFSLKENKLLWSGITSTSNPTQMDKTIQEIANAVYKRMVDDKFIQGK